MTAPVITLDQVDIFYDSPEGRAQAVTGASLTVSARETFGLVGGSGSGKSTLLRVLAGLTPTWRGIIELGGMRLEPGRAPPRSFHRRVQMVFQDPYGSLHPRRTVSRILSDGLVIHGFDGIEGRVRQTLEQVGLDARFLQRYPHELSGGQRQRVAIARALCLEPEILLLDEPTAALDASVQAEILNLLAAIRSARPMTCIFVSHDLSVVAHCCDRVAVMQRGRIVEHLTADALIEGNIQHQYTRDLLLASEGLSVETARLEAPAC